MRAKVMEQASHSTPWEKLGDARGFHDARQITSRRPLCGPTSSPIAARMHVAPIGDQYTWLKGLSGRVSSS